MLKLANEMKTMRVRVEGGSDKLRGGEGRRWRLGVKDSKGRGSVKDAK